MKYMFFDLETTSLDVRKAGILSIGLVYEVPNTGGREEFQIFMRPRGVTIRPESTAVNDLVMRKRNKVDTLCRKSTGEAIPNVYEPKDGLAAFMRYIDSKRETHEEPIVLIAHYGLKFDAKILAMNLYRFQPVFSMTNISFIDTWEMAHGAFPGLVSYKLVDLCSRFIEGFDPQQLKHDSLNDARYCYQLAKAMAGSDPVGDWMLRYSPRIPFLNFWKESFPKPKPTYNYWGGGRGNYYDYDVPFYWNYRRRY